MAASPFSWDKDEEHSEMWNVWIISSDNDKWYDYGTLAETEGGNISYNYSYIVPADVDTSIFSFVSYEPAPRADTGNIDYSYGNLLDCIDFKEYYHIKADTTPNGFGNYTNLDDNIDEDFYAQNNYSGWAISESEFKVVANVVNRKFLGAIINGEFIDVSRWDIDDDGVYSYIVQSVEDHYNIRLIFAAEHVVYDVNGGDPYHYDNTEDTGYEVPLNRDSSVYESHTATSSTDGWKFIGWQYTDAESNSYLYDAVHTIYYDYNDLDPDQDMLRISGNLVTGQECELPSISPSDGVTMVAQWKYRQRYATQVYNIETGEYDFNKQCGSYSVNISSSDTADEDDFIVDGEAVGRDYYVNDDNSTINIIATPADGYKFAGWYTPNGRLVSISRTYTYSVTDRNVETLYARFDPLGNNINITKTVNGTDTDEYFAFYVNLSGLVSEMKYKISGVETDPITVGSSLVRNPFYIEADQNGDYSGIIYLKNADTAVIHDLPSAAAYIITENDYSEAGYKTTGGHSEGTLEEGSVDISTVNTFSGVPLTVKKEVKGALGNTKAGFSFEVRFSNLVAGEQYIYFYHGQNGAKQKYTFTAPENMSYTANHQLKANEYLYFPSMTDGATYTIKEAESNHIATYKVEMADTGAIIKNGGNTSSGSELITEECSVSEADGPVIATIYNTRDLAAVTGVAPTRIIKYSILFLLILLSIVIVCKRQRSYSKQIKT